MFTKHFFTFLVMLSSFFLVVSCDKDPCKDVSCVPFSTCVEGDCICESGREKSLSGACVCAGLGKISNANNDCVCAPGLVTLTDGTCGCNSGYTLNAATLSCVLDSIPVEDTTTTGTGFGRNKFLGTYTTIEDCSLSSASEYQTAILIGLANINQIRIDNFWGFFNAFIDANLTSATTFTIPLQEPDGDDYFVSGSGTINETTGVITLNYTITGPDGTDNCTNTIYTPN